MLDDVKHVEAVALVRALVESPGDMRVYMAAEQWLIENHPTPAMYLAAMASMDHTPAPTTSNGEGL